MSEDDLGDVWARSLADLADMQIEPHQRAWLQLTRPLGLVENTALIAAPNDFVKEQLETRLRALITNALSRELARSIQLAVTVDPAATADLGQPAVRDGHVDDDITGPLPAAPPGAPLHDGAARDNLGEHGIGPDGVRLYGDEYRNGLFNRLGPGLAEHNLVSRICRAVHRPKPLPTARSWHQVGSHPPRTDPTGSPPSGPPLTSWAPRHQDQVRRGSIRSTPSRLSSSARATASRTPQP